MPLLRSALGLTLFAYASIALGAIRGVVFDTRGNAVAGARVTIARAETVIVQRMRVIDGTTAPAIAEATTDENGAFALDTKVGGVVHLRVMRDGFAPAQEIVLADEEMAIVELTAAAPRKGRITASGKPVDGATLTAYFGTSIVWTTKTAADGTYTMPHPKGWCTSLLIVHPDFAPLAVENLSRADFALDAGADITGTITGSNGRPVPNATVFGGWRITKSGDDGTYTLRHLAADEKVISAFEGSTFGTAPRDAKSTAIRIEPRASISGTVRDANGKPVEGMIVWAVPGQNETSAESRQTVSDAKGNYVLEDLDATEYFISTEDPPQLDFETKTVSLRRTSNARADLAASNADYFTGIVVDEEKHPVAGARVQYTAAQMPLIYGVIASQYQVPSGRTGRDGRFRIRRDPRITGDPNVAARLYAMHPRYAIGRSDVLQRDTSRVTIALPSGIEVTGVVKDAEGSAIAGAGVTVLQDPSGAVPMPVDMLLANGLLQPLIESDASGHFSIRLNAATHDFGIWKTGYVGARVGGVQPRAGQEPMSIVLARGVEIRGRVTSKKSLPRDGMVFVTDEMMARYSTASVAEDGTFTVEGLTEGSYELTYRSGTPHSVSGPSVSKTVQAPSTNVVIELPETGEIRGRVIDATTRAPIRKFTIDNETTHGEEIDGDGTFTLQANPGSSAVTVKAAGYVSEKMQINVEPEKTAEATFALTPGRTVSGRVTGEQGEPIAEAWLNTEAEAHRITDSDGAFQLDGFSREAAQIRVRKEGYSSQKLDVAAGDHDVHLDVVLSKGRELRGHVVTLTPTAGLHVRLTDARNGKTLDGYVVAIDSAGLQVARTSEAKKDGAMVVPVGAGAYRIAVSANGYASQSARTTVPHEGELRFALTAGGTLIVQTDRPSVDLVKLVLPNGEEYVQCQCNGIAEIRLTGTTTTVEHVAPGTYTMQVLDARGLIKTSHPVTIAEGQTTRIEIQVPE